MKYLVKWVFMLAVDAGADPEAAGLARAIFGKMNVDRVLRPIEFHLAGQAGNDRLSELVKEFRRMFHTTEDGLCSSAVHQLRDGPSAISIYGAELHFREDVGTSVSEWQVLESWRKN